MPTGDGTEAKVLAIEMLREVTTGHRILEGRRMGYNGHEKK